MSHGYPDWGVFAPKKTTYALQDMAELAARIKPVNTFDRRGDVIWWDDFEDNLNKWQQSTVGTGAGIALSSDAARSGGLSAKLTTGDAIDDFAILEHRCPYPALSKIGFEISFVVAGDKEQYRFGILIWDGTNAHLGEVRYDSETDKLEYYDSAASWQTIASDVALYDSIYLFHTLKLVVDFVNDKYIRCIVDKTEYDLSAYDLCVAASPVSPYLYARFSISTKEDANKTTYADDAISTQNEP